MNGDGNTVEHHELQTITTAKFIRFHPVTQHTWNCLRVEVYKTAGNEDPFCFIVILLYLLFKWSYPQRKWNGPGSLQNVAEFCCPSLHSFEVIQLPSEGWGECFVESHAIGLYRAFSFTWSASMQMSWNRRKPLLKKRIQLPQDCLYTPINMAAVSHYEPQRSGS